MATAAAAQLARALPPLQGRVLALKRRFPKQSPSSKQHRCCFEVCETPAGSEPDDAGSRNNQNTMETEMNYCLLALRGRFGTGEVWDWGGLGLGKFVASPRPPAQTLLPGDRAPGSAPLPCMVSLPWEDAAEL